MLAIPVYNERRHVVEVSTEARRFVSDVVVIDDGSTDGTADLLDSLSGIAVVRHRENLGYGASLASAFEHAVRHGYEWVITMDCDHQHEPASIPSFLAAAASDQYDIISGSRYLAAFVGADAPPAERREINGRITRLLNDRLGLRISDAFCGFKAYRVAILDTLRITVPGYAMPLQLWVQAWRAGLRITELPVKLIYNDPSRHFGGMLDDPVSRYRHYLRVFEAEMAAGGTTSPSQTDCGVTAA